MRYKTVKNDSVLEFSNFNFKTIYMYVYAPNLQMSVYMLQISGGAAGPNEYRAGFKQVKQTKNTQKNIIPKMKRSQFNSNSHLHIMFQKVNTSLN